MISIVKNARNNTLNNASVHFKPIRLDIKTTHRCITKN
jgi:hypothetical protein